MHERGDGGLPGLLRYWRVIREHLWIVIGCTVIGVLVAGAYVATAAKMYRAQAQMLISPIDASNSSTVGLPVLHTSSDPTRDALTAASLITNPGAAVGTITALHLHQSSTQLLANVTATPVGGSSLIALQAVSPSASQAQQIANTFAQQVIVQRTAALHRAVSTVLPGLRAQLAAESPAVRTTDPTLTSQIRQLEQLQSAPDPTIALASPAELPTAPYTPRSKLAVAAGLVGGLLIGIAAAFLFDMLDPKLQREEQIRDVLGLRVLARIPQERRRRRWRASPGPILPRDMSFIAREGYRTLRLVLTAAARGSARTFLVTGSDPGEGKTTSALNLAASLAKGGKRVILIDADLRRPSIGASLGVTTEQGTEHVLFGHTPLHEALVSAKVLQHSVRVLAVHAPRARLVEEFSYDDARRLVSEAAELADYVVIDSPPIAAVVDALPLAEVVDDILVVARLSVSRLSKLAEMRDLLGAEGTPPIGIILIGDQPARRSVDLYYSPEEVKRNEREASSGAEARPAAAPRLQTGAPGTGDS